MNVLFNVPEHTLIIMSKAANTFHAEEIYFWKRSLTICSFRIVIMLKELKKLHSRLEKDNVSLKC